MRVKRSRQAGRKGGIWGLEVMMGTKGSWCKGRVRLCLARVRVDRSMLEPSNLHFSMIKRFLPPHDSCAY